MNLNSIAGKIISIIFLTATIFGCGSSNNAPVAVAALNCSGGNGGGGFIETAPGIHTATVILTGDQETPPSKLRKTPTSLATRMSSFEIINTLL